MPPFDKFGKYISLYFRSILIMIIDYFIIKILTLIYGFGQLPSYHPPVRSSPLSPWSVRAESPRHGILLVGGSLPERWAS